VEQSFTRPHRSNSIVPVVSTWCRRPLWSQLLGPPVGNNPAVPSGRGVSSRHLLRRPYVEGDGREAPVPMHSTAKPYHGV